MHFRVISISVTWRVMPRCNQQQHFEREKREKEERKTSGLVNPFTKLVCTRALIQKFLKNAV